MSRRLHEALGFCTSDSDVWVIVPFSPTARGRRGLVRNYYPEIFSRLDIPPGYTLAFLLKDRKTVLRHTAFADHSPAGTLDSQILIAIFPEGDIGENTEHGTMWFPPVKGKHGGFSAMYAAYSAVR